MTTVNRPCEGEGCPNRAVLGVQLIKADDERRHETRWSCIVCLPPLFRMMAQSVESAVALELLNRLMRER